MSFTGKTILLENIVDLNKYVNWDAVKKLIEKCAFVFFVCGFRTQNVQKKMPSNCPQITPKYLTHSSLVFSGENSEHIRKIPNFHVQTHALDHPSYLQYLFNTPQI